jgi:hypothetical protein
MKLTSQIFSSISLTPTHCPASLQKRRPSGVCASLGSGLDPVIAEDIGDGATSNLMSQIRQCASGSRVPPRGIFKCHLKNEFDGTNAALDLMFHFYGLLLD